MARQLTVMYRAHLIERTWKASGGPAASLPLVQQHHASLKQTSSLPQISLPQMLSCKQTALTWCRVYWKLPIFPQSLPQEVHFEVDAAL